MYFDEKPQLMPIHERQTNAFKKKNEKEENSLQAVNPIADSGFQLYQTYLVRCNYGCALRDILKASVCDTTKMTDANEWADVVIIEKDAPATGGTEVKPEVPANAPAPVKAEDAAKEKAPEVENGKSEETEKKADATTEDPNAWRPHEDVNSSFTKPASGKDGDEEGETNTKQGNEVAEGGEKKRTYNRKVVRLPKEVFDFMAKIEEDGVVRFNLTQFGVFYLNELKFMGTNVDALDWLTADVPLLNVSVPPTAKGDPTLIVDHFSSDPAVREAQETRLKGILENREKLKQVYASGGKILPADGVDKKIAKRQRKRERREERKKMMEQGQGAGTPAKADENNKKRSAENTESSTTIEGGVAAKQPRLDTNATKTFPKKSGGPQTGNQTIAKPATAVKNPPAKKKPPPKRATYNEWQSGPGYFGGNSAGRDRFRQKPRPFQDTRPREIPSLFSAGRGPSGVSPWSRPPFQEDVRSLEQVMRRAAHDNSSSFDTARQVDRLGLGSAMGSLLSSAPERDMPMGLYNDVPTRQMPSLVDSAFNRRCDELGASRYGEEFGIGRYGGARDAPVRDISSFVEPIDDFMDSPRKNAFGQSSHADRITYPSMGGASGRSNAAIPPLLQFGQSYSAFANESYGQRMDYGSGSRPRSVSPYGRAFYR
ncbi:unnamed protein product [Cylicocyclus nassatus]|uniref:Uncharacterized protein n=1 Tax=Cylicocyclus nassatus TaxID=53992 RepID=A0AA36GTU2_CYLNA|nr:unnamed protein product [Cylicocyclus nassatus]